ncbi:MAG TPA: hypothetical protein PKC19_18040 [Roseiflexaceae bacterium]|nr:hypothetical protein [Roseiflexaceae bacterium]
MIQLPQIDKWPLLPALFDNPWWPFEDKPQGSRERLLIKLIEIRYG